MYIVSACLLGEPCRYDGNDNLTDWVKELTEDHTVCMVCPETLGKLSVPRPKSEIKDGAVINEEGEDVTKAFEDGARIAYIRAVAAAMSIGEEIEGAILKSNSPSCGKDKVYDGTFTGTMVDGEGIFAKTLREHGIKIYTEKEKF
ncbi:DUF523 domain-containing protein [Gallibacter intestinalis]|uniref:DUF523 domain-containing protein n=1 Tax=Gallibacter intestinalis TaxID=2779356 RepID=A0ABR9QY10_9FIRM|nr:DUF523 domain-containing protein [Gallibacter intestinalis]MBE5035781.1 DUF523 domain-containing protein [Gallibacter intestinalis]